MKGTQSEFLIVFIDYVYIRLVKHTIDVGSMKVYLTVG